jgi:hypothetical protein
MSRSPWKFAGGDPDVMVLARKIADPRTARTISIITRSMFEIRAVVPMARLRSQACRLLVVLRQDHVAPA